MQRYCGIIRRRVWHYRTICILMTIVSQPAWGQDWRWINHFGTTNLENNLTVSADALGNVFVTGATRGSLGGANAGDWDVFVRKFNAAGETIWTQQQGTIGVDISLDIAADGVGGTYLTGGSRGDAFVSRYDSAGNLMWHREIDSGSNDVGVAVAVGPLGDVYVSGDTDGGLDGNNQGRSDVFVEKFSQTGDLLWTKQFGTSSSDFNGGISADDSGNIYVTGSTAGALEGTNHGSFDAFIRKLDANGNVQWTRQFGTEEEDSIRAVSADQLGNIFVGGDTFGSLGSPYSGSEGDAFAAKFDAAGNREWSRQFGTSTLEQLYDLASDRLGNVFFVGQTRGSLFALNAGAGDMFFGQLDHVGNLILMQQFGTKDFDIATGVSADGHGSVYVSGLVLSLGGEDSDAFVAKTPEPAASAILASGLLVSLITRRI